MMGNSLTAHNYQNMQKERREKEEIEQMTQRHRLKAKATDEKRYLAVGEVNA